MGLETAKFSLEIQIEVWTSYICNMRLEVPLLHYTENHNS